MNSKNKKWSMTRRNFMTKKTTPHQTRKTLHLARIKEEIRTGIKF